MFIPKFFYYKKFLTRQLPKQQHHAQNEYTFLPKVTFVWTTHCIYSTPQQSFTRVMKIFRHFTRTFTLTLRHCDQSTPTHVQNSNYSAVQTICASDNDTKTYPHLGEGDPRIAYTFNCCVRNLSPLDFIILEVSPLPRHNRYSILARVLWALRDLSLSPLRQHQCLRRKHPYWMKFYYSAN